MKSPTLLLRLLTAAATAVGAAPDCAVAAGVMAGLQKDQTAALNAALLACEGRSVTVPPGLYRVDGTVAIGSEATDPFPGRTGLAAPTHLVLGNGVELRRFRNMSSSTAPVVRLAGHRCRLTGDGGRVVSENAAPIGIVHLGPANKSVPSSLQFAVVSGIHISGHYEFDGLEPKKRRKFLDIDSNPPWTPASGYEQCGGFKGQVAAFGKGGTLGLCMDSSQPVSAGAAYQNTVRDVIITSVDVGLYMGQWANGNHVENIQLISIGTTSLWLENNSENTVLGGFTGGTFPGSPYPYSGSFKSVIRGTASMFNWFSGVQGEAGLGSYFTFDKASAMNTVLGHDNFAEGPQSEDKEFLYINSGSLSATGKVSAAKLVCDATGKDVCAASSGDADAGGALRSRLVELERLRGEGLIDEEEHAAARRAALGL